MSDKKTNCGDCAYVQKGELGLWCPFHDEPVSDSIVCNNFLNKFDSPTFSSLVDELKDEREPIESIPQFTTKDKLAIVLTGVLLITGIICALFF